MDEGKAEAEESDADGERGNDKAEGSASKGGDEQAAKDEGT